MKKVKFLIAAILSSTMIFMSCANSPSDSSSDENNSLNAEKRALYNSALLNTSWENLDNDTRVYASTIVFKENEIIYDGVSYSITDNDLHFDSEGGEYATKTGVGYSLAIKFNNRLWAMDPGKAWDSNSKTFDSTMKVLKLTGWNLGSCQPYKKVSSDDSSSSDSSASSESVTVSGKYNAKGSKSGASTTFTNGTWTFSYLSSSKTGSYSQSGNELTIKYSTGSVSASAVFTVSKGDSDNVVNLKGKSGDIATIVSNVFSTTDSDALTNGNVILTVN